MLPATGGRNCTLWELISFFALFVVLERQFLVALVLKTQSILALFATCRSVKNNILLPPLKTRFFYSVYPFKSVL
jgi:hypothetical protein